MTIFKINDPYFAIIAAQDEEECIKLYEEVVSDVEDEDDFFYDLTVLETSVAITQMSKTIDEDTQEEIGLEEAFKQIEECMNSKEAVLLAMDGSLI